MSTAKSLSSIHMDDFRQFFELSRDLFLVTDINGTIIRANSAWQSILGYSVSDLIGTYVTELIHPDDVVRTRVCIREAAEVERHDGIANRYRCKDGSYRLIKWGSVVSANVIYAVGLDITGDNDAKSQLEEANRLMHQALKLEREARVVIEGQQERFRDLFAQAPMIAVVFSGPKQVIELANPSFYTLVNYRNLMGRPVREAIHLDKNTSDILNDVYKTGRRFVGKNFVIKADWIETDRAVEKMFHCVFEPVCGRDGSVEVIWCLLFDVTEAIELEAKLRAAERMASLGEMAAGVAHEINNPLGYTLISLEMLSEKFAHHFGQVPNDMLDILNRATEGVERVQKIVKGLKSFTRNDESRMEPVDLRAPITAAVNFTSNETRHRAVVTTEFLAAPKTNANEGRLTQVFINLIVNAAQAIEPGHANDHFIRIKLFTDKQGSAVIEIQDSGSGISADNLQRIFEPFYTSKPVGVGTGLGLSICHGIITGFGGHIEVESVPGAGTTFKVIMPASLLIVPSTAVETLGASSDSDLKNADSANSKKRILVIDDDKSLRDVIVAALEEDYNVVAVESAVEALEKIRVGPIDFDWIVCDVMMPQMTGMEFFEKIKERGDGSEKKIILMTGGAFTPAARSWMDALTNPKLEKPFRIRQLKQLFET